MDFAHSARAQDLLDRIGRFLNEEVEPLKDRARELGLWNLFLPADASTGGEPSVGLSNVEHAPLAERMRCWTGGSAPRSA